MNGALIIAIELDFFGHTLLFYKNTPTDSEGLCHLVLRADASNSKAHHHRRPYASAAEQLQGISVSKQAFLFVEECFEQLALFVKLKPKLFKTATQSNSKRWRGNPPNGNLNRS